MPSVVEILSYVCFVAAVFSFIMICYKRFRLDPRVKAKSELSKRVVTTVKDLSRTKDLKEAAEEFKFYPLRLKGQFVRKTAFFSYVDMPESLRRTKSATSEDTESGCSMYQLFQCADGVKLMVKRGWLDNEAVVSVTQMSYESQNEQEIIVIYPKGFEDSKSIKKFCQWLSGRRISTEETDQFLKVLVDEVRVGTQVDDEAQDQIHRPKVEEYLDSNLFVPEKSNFVWYVM